MSNHIERMNVEADELQKRIDKLEAFIISQHTNLTIDDHQLTSLHAQKHAMETYLYILHGRIKYDEEKENK